MATSAVMNPPGLGLTFEPIEPVTTENIQTRIAKIYAKILTILSDAARSDQEKTSSIKKQIKKLSSELADASTWQGQTAILTAFINIPFIVASCLGTKTPHEQQVWLTIGNTASDTISKFLNARTESGNALTASERDLLSKELERMISESTTKQGFKNEVSGLFNESLQVAKGAARFG